MDREDATPLLSALSARAQHQRDFMGYVLREYLQSEGLTEDELCSRLGITLELLVRLSLCRRPDSNNSDFLESVSAVADYALCDEDVLLQLIRHVDALDALRTADRRSMLSAARDRSQDEPERTEADDQGGTTDQGK